MNADDTDSNGKDPRHNFSDPTDEEIGYLFALQGPPTPQKHKMMELVRLRALEHII